LEVGSKVRAASRKFLGLWGQADISHCVTDVLATPAAPVYVHAPASTFLALEEVLKPLVSGLLRRARIGAERRVLTVGPWAGAFARLLKRSGWPCAEEIKLPVIYRAAVRQAAKRPKYSHTLQRHIHVGAKSAKRAVSIRVLNATTRLPATRILRDFPSSNFTDRFHLALAIDGSDETETLFTYDVPRYAASQNNSYLKVAVHRETEHFILFETAYLFSTARHIVIYDKRSRKGAEVPEDIFRRIRST